MSKSLKAVGILFVVGLLFVGVAAAQIPANLSSIRSSQITDAQLMQFLQQAQSTGMSEDQLIQEFKRRGLPDAELEGLVNRIKLMTGVSLSIGADDEPMEDSKDGKSTIRKYKGESRPFKIPAKPSRVFGADLFSGADPLFIPNLKIATPKGYVLGADDELQLDIYGNNISNQKLTVSPDGFITVRYAGPINVSGMTIEQAAGVIKSRLTKFYPAMATGATKLQLSLGSVRSIQVTVVGAVKRPGTITLPSIATLFNALYSSGGPLDNGSFRNIELVRVNKVVALADLYDFMLKGDQASNVTLRDNDVIRVPYAKLQIALEGGVNRVGVFEVKSTETIQHALDYAGGLRGNAFKGRITGTRYTDVEKSVIDVAKDQFSNFRLLHGDSLYIDTVVDKFSNRVYITGAVFKPGAYSLDQGMDVKSLIAKAQGLKEDAFLNVANMVRLRDDYTKEYVTLNLRDVISGNSRVQLKREDSVNVESILNLRDSVTVYITGPVKNPGIFRYEDSLTLNGLILKAGGLSENASALKIEVGRRAKGVQVVDKGAKTSEIFYIDIEKDLTYKEKEFILQPFDVVNIKRDPTKVNQLTVSVEGEVFLVGDYTLENPEERLSSVINRAGGLLPYADPQGVRLIRIKLLKDTAFIKLLARTNIDGSKKNKERSDSSQILDLNQLNSQTTEVAIDLSKIMRNPGGEDDPYLQNGDRIIVPKIVNTISISGAVLRPVTVQYESKKNFDYYISSAGGYSRNAYKKRVFIVYSNNRSQRTKSFLGIRSYPAVRPGSTIFVPMEPVKENNFGAAEAGVLVSAFSAIMTTIALLTR